MTTTRPLLALLLAAFFLLVPVSGETKKPGAPALAAPADWDAAPSTGERILSFASDIEVTADGALIVAETIRVRSEGREIRRGITRDFPTRYRQGNRNVRVGFEVESIERDGRAEPWDRERMDNGVRLRIGDPDVFLPDGEHTYVIRYRTTRQLGFFDDYDELNWNVTGNDWTFPIDRAEARIRLPQPVRFGQRTFYTGPQSSTAGDARTVSERPGEILVRTTSPLRAREGLTVAIAWPKGVVTPPAPPSAAAVWLQTYGPIAAAILALAGLAYFYYYAWKRAGRGPVAGTVVPLFAPPEGMSAAAIRYVRRMGYDNRAFAAAIVDSGVKGNLRLEEGEGGWFSSATTTIHQTGDASNMPAPERDMLARLFGGGASILMDKANHATFRAAQSGLQEGLEGAYLGKLFLTNKGWAWVGLVLMLAAMLFVATIVAAIDPYGERGTALLPAFGFVLMIGSIWAGKGSRLARTDGSKWLAALSILLGLGGGVFVVFAFALITEAGELPFILAVLSPLLALPLVLSAFRWMAAPTGEGRKVMDEIAGFERYLSVTEEDRLETLHPPEKTPELFERYLPHAIALEVENRWAGKFASVLAAASADPARQGGRMGWYSGSHNAWSNPGIFATAVGATLASSVASASTAPGSSSGSGGGGSSGGGGGGGGGGGW
ncbi:MAG TPA: DUF2207 domain-containing protein [Allosphingosinicella sp.]|nr:DUF2207 domain-containing protein [Allosphingosinicella sp.]